MVANAGTLCLNPTDPRGKQLLKDVMNAEHVHSVEVDAVQDDGNMNFKIMM